MDPQISERGAQRVVRILSRIEKDPRIGQMTPPIREAFLEVLSAFQNVAETRTSKGLWLPGALSGLADFVMELYTIEDCMEQGNSTMYEKHGIPHLFGIMDVINAKLLEDLTQTDKTV